MRECFFRLATNPLAWAFWNDNPTPIKKKAQYMTGNGPAGLIITYAHSWRDAPEILESVLRSILSSRDRVHRISTPVQFSALQNVSNTYYTYPAETEAIGEINVRDGTSDVALAKYRYRSTQPMDIRVTPTIAPRTNINETIAKLTWR